MDDKASRLYRVHGTKQLNIDPIMKTLYVKDRPAFTLPPEPREIDLIHHMLTALQCIRPVASNWAQTAAIYSLLFSLAEDGEGRFEIDQQPDEVDRQQPQPDYVLRNAASGVLLTVEATQLFTYRDQLKHFFFQMDLLVRLCPHIKGKVEGTHLLVFPQYVPISFQDIDHAAREVGEAMVTASPSLPAIEATGLPLGFILIKLSDDGEHLSWCTQVEDTEWRCKPHEIVRDTETCRAHLRPILDEASTKFADSTCGESVLLVTVHLAETIDFTAAAMPLRAEYAGIDRLYTVPAGPGQRTERIW